MVFRYVLLALAMASAELISADLESYHEDAFNRINDALFPKLLNAPIYRTFITNVVAIDGVPLYTVAFVPLNPLKKYDTVMIRTPYGTDGVKGEGESYISQGFAVVMQDFRGRYKSSGQFACWFNASTDAASTVDWIVSQSWSSGVIFQQGTSAPGIALYFSEISSFPPTQVRALFPVVATGELHKSIFQGGAYRYSLMHGWLTSISELPFERNFTSHEGLSDYWDNVTMTDKWARVSAPAVHLTGWYDIFNQQQIDSYYAYQTKSTYGRGANFLIILPTGHCAGGQVPWPNWSDGYNYANELSVALFKAVGTSEHNVTAQKLLATLSPMNWYVLGPGLPGTIGNYWTNGTSFPPSRFTDFYLADGALNTTTAPSEGSRNFIYNPLSPVPTLGGNNLVLPQCGPWDQSSLESRPDVLVFTSPKQAAPLAIAGKMTATLYVSSNCTDTDFTVKVTDVFPNGTSLLVQDGILRMKWRNDKEAPDLLTPGTLYQVDVDIWSTCYIFNVGHSIRLTISSSNYPRFSANPNNGLPLDQSGPFIPASNTVYFGPLHPSRLVLPVVDINDLPPTSFPKLALP